ncbi:hypothetical protein ACFFJ6_17245 [Rhodopseudomonas telluris]|uniref:Uncharacterized protein n=1 Tax=Rhodopseudomonas telluris TaxID=644215 RepID=A0ABV6EVL8_9BRAD
MYSKAERLSSTRSAWISISAGPRIYTGADKRQSRED